MSARPSSQSERVARPDLDAVPPVDVVASADAAPPPSSDEPASPRVGRRMRAEPEPVVESVAEPIASRPVGRRHRTESGTSEPEPTPAQGNLREPAVSARARRPKGEPDAGEPEATPPRRRAKTDSSEDEERESASSARVRRVKTEEAEAPAGEDRESAVSGRVRRVKSDEPADEPAPTRARRSRTEGAEASPEALITPVASGVPVEHDSNPPPPRPPRRARTGAETSDEAAALPPAEGDLAAARARRPRPAEVSDEAAALPVSIPVDGDAATPRARRTRAADAHATPPGGTRIPLEVQAEPDKPASGRRPKAEAEEPGAASRSGRQVRVEVKPDPKPEPAAAHHPAHAHAHAHHPSATAPPLSPTPASAGATPGAPLPAPTPQSAEPGPRFEEARPTRTPMPVEATGEPGVEDQPISAELLQKRICDLGLQIEGRLLGRVVDRFKQELREVGITRVVPGFYLSTEWGVAEETIAIAIPFYLADEELTKVQAAKGGIVEGTSEEDILRYLRHEMGHVINYAYKLYQTEEWSLLFGPMARPYTEDYRAVPFSPEYVRHLPGNYAQKHPDEDWSETFAVWMDRSIEWRALYSDAPGAIKKLEYCERTLRGLLDKDPLVTDLTRDEDVSEIHVTIGEFYEGQGAVEIRVPRSLDGDLRAIFGPLAPAKPAAEGGPRLGSGSLLLRRQRDVIANTVFRWTSVDPAYVRPILDHLIRRAKELDLTYPLAERDTVLIQVTGFLTTLAMNYVYKGRFIAS